MLTILSTVAGLFFASDSGFAVLAASGAHTRERVELVALDGEVVGSVWCSEAPRVCSQDLGGPCPLEDGHFELLATGYSELVSASIITYTAAEGNDIFSATWAGRGDWVIDGVVDSVDLFGYLDAFFAGDPRADFNLSGGVDSSDFFAFLDAWRPPE